MNATTIFGEIKKRQTEVNASDSDLMLAAGLSPKQWRSRVIDPGKFRLLELEGISNYLGLRITAHR